MPGARPFLGGIADAQGQRAAVRDRAGRVCAVALDAGTLLWRSAEPLAPLLLPPGEVIACTLGPAPACVALAWSGPQAGTPVWRSQPLGLPAAPDATLQIEAEADAAGTITLRWQGGARYRGGAAPGAAVLAASRRAAQGAVRVDRRSGQVAPVAAAPARSAAPAESPAAAADALGAADIGPRHFEFALREQPGGRVQTVLRARDRAAGHALWELTIDDVPRTPPRPLRA